MVPAYITDAASVYTMPAYFAEWLSKYMEPAYLTDTVSEHMVPSYFADTAEEVHGALLLCKYGRGSTWCPPTTIYFIG
jgi:hypothetical protein